MTVSTDSAATIKARTTLAMIADDFHTPKVIHILDGASHRATEHGVNLICAVIPPTPDRCPLRDLIGTENCDALLVLSSLLSNFERSKDRIAKFFERYKPLPCVSMGDPFDGLHSVQVDNHSGMRDIITHLIKVHHFHKIAFIRGPATNSEAEERFTVYREVLEANGLVFDPDLVADGNWKHASGALAVYTLKDLRHRKFEAIVACNDAMAAGAYEALHARGIRVPLDIAVVGFDNFDGSGYSLTTIEQPVYEMGCTAVDIALALSQGKTDVPMQVILPTRTILRRSCGCIPTEVQNATAEPAPPAPVSMLAVRREAVSQALLRASGGADSDAPPEWPGRLFAAFLHEISEGKRGELLSELDSILMQEWMERRHSGTWQGVISELRREALPSLNKNAILASENVWHQARVLISEAAQRVRRHQEFTHAQRTTQLMDVSSIFGSPDVKTLCENFARRVPTLGIERCYAVLYENNATDGGVPEWSRLVMALDEEETTPLDSEGLRFPSRQLLPPDILPPYRAVTLIALPLMKDNQHMGLIYFEKSDVEFYVYQMLARQFSEPLSRIIKPAPSAV